MKSWLFLALGGVLAVTGGVWTLQGLGFLGGSPMTSVRLWAIIGPIVVVAGLVLAGVGLRRMRAR